MLAALLRNGFSCNNVWLRRKLEDILGKHKPEEANVPEKGPHSLYLHNKSYFSGAGRS